MSIGTKFIDSANEFHILVKGKFDFSQLNDFRNAYESFTNKTVKYVIDMREVNMLDSSALGMLLKMKRSVNAGDKAIKIINCNADVNKILSIANFGVIFDID